MCENIHLAINMNDEENEEENNEYEKESLLPKNMNEFIKKESNEDRKLIDRECKSNNKKKEF